MILGDLDFITHQGFPSSPARLPSWRPRLVGLISAHTPQQTACPDSSCVPSSSSRFSLVGPGSHPSPLLRHRESPFLSSLRNWLRLRHCWAPTRPSASLCHRLALGLCLSPHAHKMAATGLGILALAGGRKEMGVGVVPARVSLIQKSKFH